LDINIIILFLLAFLDLCSSLLPAPPVALPVEVDRFQASSEFFRFFKTNSVTVGQS